jgi:heat shock protein HslJ
MVQRPLFVLYPLLLAGAAALAAPAAPSAKPDANAKLRDTRWMLAVIDGAAVLEPQMPAKSQASQHLSGSTGCNQVNGRFTQRGTQLAIKALSTTKRACAEPLMVQEQKLVAALMATDAYRIEGSRLSLMQNETVRVVFEAAKGKSPRR